MRALISQLIVLAFVLSPLSAYARHHHPHPYPSPTPDPTDTASPTPDPSLSPDPQPSPTDSPSPTPSPSPVADSPECLDHGQAIPVNDAQVLQWKQSTPNQYLARAHVEGTITQVFPDHSGHRHFEITIGPNPGDTLEVIYNESFGVLPHLSLGLTVEACGDYITSNAQAGPYPASPDQAIIHWVHANPSGHGHDSGFLVIDGVLCGQGSGN